MDVAIIDVPWNGVGESLKIAAMADTYEVNVAPHNFYGHLATHDERPLLRGGARTCASWRSIPTWCPGTTIWSP